MLRAAAAGTMGPGEDSPSPPPPLPSQLPLSSSHLNVYSGDPQVTASLVGVTSSSCPADLTQKRELTGTMSSCLYLWGSPSSFFLSAFFPTTSLLLWPPDAESRALAKERQKKDNHNLSESCWPPSAHLGWGASPCPIPALAPLPVSLTWGTGMLQGCDPPSPFQAF